MAASRELTLAYAILLAAMAIYDFFGGGSGDALRLNADTGAFHAAAAIWALLSVRMGARACNVFLVAGGLLFCVDGFMGLTRGMFYLSMQGLNGPVQPLAESDRLLASLPHLVLGGVALVSGMIFANRDAGTRHDPPPP